MTTSPPDPFEPGPGLADPGLLDGEPPDREPAVREPADREPADREPADREPADLEGTVTWRQLQAEAERRLLDAGSSSAAIDARRIVERAGGFEGAGYVLGLDEAATTRSV